MTDLLITDVGGGTWDLTITDGDVVWTADVSRLQEVAQRVVYRLMTWLGESIYDRDIGVPYIDGIFGFEPIAGIGGVLTQVIIDTPGVDGTDGAPEYALAAGVFTLSVTIVVADETTEIALEITA